MKTELPMNLVNQNPESSEHRTTWHYPGRYRVLLCTLFFAVCGFCFSSTTFAQKSEKTELLEKKYKRAMSSIATAYNESRRNSELELVDSQKGEIEELYGQYRATLKTAKAIPKNEREERMPSLVADVVRLKDEILNSVLLPEQANILRKKIFANRVKSNNGNIIRTIVNDYGDELNLDEVELDRLKEVEKKTAEKIRAAREKFEEELKEIAKNLREDLSGALPQEHLELIDGLEFSKPKNSKDLKGDSKEKKSKKKKSARKD